MWAWVITSLSSVFRLKLNWHSINFLIGCTTHRLSYIPNNHMALLRNNSYAPHRLYQRPNLPMESETTMRLSYQPVEPVVPVSKPWSKMPLYKSPITPIDDNTTYNLRYLLIYSIASGHSFFIHILTASFNVYIVLHISYIPPGTLVPLSSCCAPCSMSNNCAGNYLCNLNFWMLQHKFFPLFFSTIVSTVSSLSCVVGEHTLILSREIDRRR